MAATLFVIIGTSTGEPVWVPGRGAEEGFVVSEGGT